MNDFRTLIRDLENAGIKVIKSRHNHYKIYLHNRLILAVPSTSTSSRGLRNTKTTLRRAGITI